MNTDQWQLSNEDDEKEYSNTVLNESKLLSLDKAHSYVNKELFNELSKTEKNLQQQENNLELPKLLSSNMKQDSKRRLSL